MCLGVSNKYTVPHIRFVLSLEDEDMVENLLVLFYVTQTLGSTIIYLFEQQDLTAYINQKQAQDD